MHIHAAKAIADDASISGSSLAEKLAFKAKPNRTIFETILASHLPHEEKSRARLAQEAFVIIEAGAETTSRTLAYATYYILTDKVVYSRLMQELRIAIPDASIVANVAVLEQLPWLVGRSRKLLPSKSC